MKIGDKVSCYVALKNGRKRVSISKTNEKEEFEIIGIKPIYCGCEYNYYKILLPDNYIGWKLGMFNVKFEDIDNKHLGKLFYDITEEFIIKNEPIEKNINEA